MTREDIVHIGNLKCVWIFPYGRGEKNGTSEVIYLYRSEILLCLGGVCRKRSGSLYNKSCCCRSDQITVYDLLSNNTRHEKAWSKEQMPYS